MSSSLVVAEPKAPRPKVAKRAVHAIPQEILDDPLLAACMQQLPSNYSFEVHKTIWKVREAGATCVALQFP